ncbi:thioredoxin domain-containing protein 15 [Galendromus occidentalis]|uniref:Thioredoxin domain-containing protein 15 n=1 Tax=Galendromus occidentalis TaxID=34638 RepID=A0AAJ6QTW2_9ACAR|nr:thioredoxin domain-containing protein 15 [Galendromus occidentalis]
MLTRVIFLFLLLGRESISTGDDYTSTEDNIVIDEPDCASTSAAPDPQCANSTVESETLTADDVKTTIRNDSRRISCAAPLNPFNEVVIFNASAVADILSAARNECTLLIFYSPHCMFSVRSSPYLNGIARYYLNLSVVAIQINESSTLSMKYGIIATPTVLLLHNHRAIAKLNHTNVSLEALGNFIEKHTGLPLVENMTLTDLDYLGPLPTKVVERADWILFSAWVFTIWSLLWFLLRSSYALRAYTWFATTWKEAREAEQAARPHQD